jgi:hypothetical protein
MINSAIATRLEKAALDNGFDLRALAVEGWLGFASSQAPLRLWLTSRDPVTFVAAVSQKNVADALSEFGTSYTLELPATARGARAVAEISALHHLVRRAFQLARTLPDELLHRFQHAVAGLPRATEAERLVIQRVGQDVFRRGLIEYWEGACAITGLAVTEILRASHIKPWAACANDAERLDIFNGLLLAPQLDAVFDAGLMTFGDDGSVVLSSFLSDGDRRLLNLHGSFHVRSLTAQHRAYLEWHRDRVFRFA